MVLAATFAQPRSRKTQVLPKRRKKPAVVVVVVAVVVAVAVAAAVVAAVVVAVVVGLT